MLQQVKDRLASGSLLEALTLLQDLLESQPGNSEASALLAAAEPRFVEQTYRETLTPETIPKLQASLETVMTMGLGPKEGFILSRINGSWDVRSILSVCPFREAESLLILRKLLDVEIDWVLATLQDHLGHCVKVGVRETEPEMPGTHLKRNLQGPSTQDENRLSTHFIFDLCIVPANPVAPSSPDGFECRLFGGKAHRVMLIPTGALFTVGNFAFRESTIAQAFSPAHHGEAEFFNLHDIGSDSDNHQSIS